MTTLSVKESLLFGWRTFKGNPWAFVKVSLILFAISFVFSFINSVLGALGKDAAETLALSVGILSLVVSLASIYVNITVNNMGVLTFFLKTHDSVASASLRDLWRPHPFWRYLLAMVMIVVLVCVGLVLLIVPGIIIGLALSLTSYIILTRDLTAWEAIKESARITKGHRFKLFLLSLAIAGLTTVGFLALFVGLLVTIPVSLLAYVHAFRTLEANAGAITPAPAA